MAKALKIIGTVAVIGGLALITGGAAAGLAFGGLLTTSVAGISAGLLLGAGALLTSASSLLAAGVKAPKVSSSTADRLQVSINTRAPRLSVFGSTALGTDLRDQEYSNDQTYLHRWVVSAGHAVRAIREIWFDDKLAWSAAGGVTSDFAGYLTVTPVLEGSAANAINTGPRMGSSRRYTGCAYVYFRYKLTGNGKKSESPFAQSIPSRVTIIGDGMPVYDPRQDSTRGGSGPCRADNQATWIRTDEACRNPALQLLTFLIGWRINGRLSVGKGVPPARIDIDSFAVAANICDEPVARSAGGTELRYRGDGVFSEADELNVVYDTFKATMNAIIDDVGGRQRVQILHNDLGTPIGSLTTADVLGAFTWDQTPALQQTINVIRGGYTDPSSASLFQLIEGPEIRGASPDGIDRDQKIDLPFVQSPSQRSRLLLMRLQRIISGGGTFTAEFQATGWKFQKGDVVRFTFAPLGWINKLFRIADLAVQVDGVVPMMLREEHPDIYLGEGNDAAAIVGAEPTRYEWSLNPILLDLEQLADDIDDAAGTAADALDAIAALGDDGVLSVNEKVTKLIPLDGELAAGWALLDAKAAAISDPEVAEARSIAAAAKLAWLTYRDSLSPAWNNTSIETAIARVTFNGKLADYRYGIALLAEALRRYLGVRIDGLDQRLIDAQQDANAALDALDALADDGIISINEKVTKLIPLNAELEAAWATLDARAAPFDVGSGSVFTSRSYAAATRNEWLAYRGTIAPAWNDTSADSPVDRAMYNLRLGNYRKGVNELVDVLRKVASETAFKAIDQIADLADDGLITKHEKITKLIPLSAELEAAWTDLDAQLATIPVDEFANGNAVRGYIAYWRQAWLDYRGTFSPAWNDTTADTVVDRDFYNTILGIYRQALNVGLDAQRRYGLFKTGQVAADAEEALDQISALADDGVLTVNEKITKLIPLDADLQNAWQLLDSQAGTISGSSSVSTARSTAANARLAWVTYRNSLSPAWNNKTLDTAVNRTTFNGKVADYRYGITLLAEALRGYLGGRIDTLDQQLGDTIDALDALADDGIITTTEKITKLIPLSGELETTFTFVDAAVATIPVAEFPHADGTRQQAAYWRNVWLTYRNGLTPAWNDTTQNTPISNRNFYNQVLINYRDSLNKMLDAQRQYGIFKTSKVAEDADDALDQIQALANDGVLSVNEKITKLIPLDAELQNAWQLLDSQAAGIVGFATVSTARTAASNARQGWIVYRNSLSPAWNNTGLDTAVARATFNGKIADYRYGLDLLADALRQYAGLPPSRGAFKVTAAYAPGTTSPIYVPSGSTDSTISIPSHDLVLEDGRRSGVDFGTFPAFTLTGLTAGVTYAVFWDFVSSSYLAEPFPAPINSNNDAMIIYEAIATSAGGSYEAVPTAPDGYRGYSGRGVAIP